MFDINVFESLLSEMLQVMFLYMLQEWRWAQCGR